MGDGETSETTPDPEELRPCSSRVRTNLNSVGGSYRSELHVIMKVVFFEIETLKRALEYEVQAPVFYGNLWEQTGKNVLFCLKTHRKLVLFLQKSPESSGSLWENVI